MKNTKNWGLFGIRQIMLLMIAITIAFSVNNAYGSAVCPKDTTWDGENCVNLKTGEPIVFTDYLGNPVVKSKNKSLENSEQIVSITAPQHEILRDLMIIKPNIVKIEYVPGQALAQKIFYDGETPPINLTRNNHHFNAIMEHSIRNAEVAFNDILNGKQVHNEDFGKNNEQQKEYSERYERSEDPVLQNQIIQENERAKQVFLSYYGNFINH